MTQTQEQAQQSSGEAYAFFDCRASKSKIEEGLPYIREQSETPNKLELSLMETRELEKSGADPKLLQFVRETETCPVYPQRLRHLKSSAVPKRIGDLRYVLHAIYPGKSDEDAVGELVNIANGVNYVFGSRGPFRGEIIAKTPEGSYGVVDV